MKQAGVKPAAALLALLVLAVVALAITRPGLANGSQAAQATPAATQAAPIRIRQKDPRVPF